jgi:predicted metalloprotease
VDPNLSAAGTTISQFPCGMAQSATGPFYCPDDEKVYIDVSFHDELKRRFGAPGDFAQPIFWRMRSGIM